MCLLFVLLCQRLATYRTCFSLKLDDSNNDDSTDDKEDEDGDSAKKVRSEILS